MSLGRSGERVSDVSRVWLGGWKGGFFLGCAVCAWDPSGSWLTQLSAYRGHFIIFSGGMPRASYGDRHCVSVLRAETLVTLDFTSRIIDFFTVHSTRPEDGVCPAVPYPFPAPPGALCHL